MNINFGTQASTNLQSASTPQHADGSGVQNSTLGVQVPGQELVGTPKQASTQVGDVTDNNRANLKETLTSINKQLAYTQTQVVYADNQPSNQVWLNVVDKTTGKVLFEVPAQAFRHLQSSGSGTGKIEIAGLLLDKRS